MLNAFPSDTFFPLQLGTFLASVDTVVVMKNQHKIKTECQRNST